MNQIQIVLQFILMGFLGGLVHVWTHSEEWSDLKTFHATGRYVLGAITGYLYSYLYSEWSFPNFIMCFYAGYSGIQVLLDIMEKAKAMRAKASKN